MPREGSHPIDPATIEEWCRQAVEGGTSALEKLLWAHRARLTGFLRRKIGVDWKGKIDLDDVLQEAYMDIFDGIAGFTYQDEDSFYRWAARIIDHKFIDQVRRLRRKKRDVAREVASGERSTSRHESFFRRSFPDLHTPSRAMRRADAVGALMTCIAQLPEHYRMVVQRLYLNEEPLAVVATDLGRSEDAVRRLGSRAVERLHRCLGRASHYLSTHG